MSESNPTPPEPAALPESRTRIVFDLRDVLSEAELERFQAAAKEAGAESLTEHFLNLTLRTEQAA